MRNILSHLRKIISRTKRNSQPDTLGDAPTSPQNCAKTRAPCDINARDRRVGFAHDDPHVYISRNHPRQRAPQKTATDAASDTYLERREAHHG